MKKTSLFLSIIIILTLVFSLSSIYAKTGYYSKYYQDNRIKRIMRGDFKLYLSNDSNVNSHIPHVIYITPGKINEKSFYMDIKGTVVFKDTKNWNKSTKLINSYIKFSVRNKVVKNIQSIIFYFKYKNVNYSFYGTYINSLGAILGTYKMNNVTKGGFFAKKVIRFNYRYNRKGYGGKGSYGGKSSYGGKNSYGGKSNYGEK